MRPVVRTLRPAVAHPPAPLPRRATHATRRSFAAPHLHLHLRIPAAAAAAVAAFDAFGSPDTRRPAARAGPPRRHGRGGARPPGPLYPSSRLAGRAMAPPAEGADGAGADGGAGDDPTIARVHHCAFAFTTLIAHLTDHEGPPEATFGDAHW